MITDARSLVCAALIGAASTACLAQVDPFQKSMPAADVRAMEDGRALRKKGRFDDAVRRLQPVAQRQPDYFNAHYELGLALATRNNETTADGIPELEKAAAIKRAHPEVNDAHVFNTLGWAYMFAGQYKKADSVFKEAERNLDQLTPEAQRRLYSNMGYLYLTQGHLKDSEKYLKLAADKYDSAQAKSNLRTLETVKKQEMKR